MADDRKIKLVLKNHDCERVGEITPFASFDAVSRVNDVGEAQIVASYGASDRSDAVLDELATPDVILEAYIQPPGHDTFLDDPVWAGFLRNRRITQDGPTKTVTAQFKDYNHLLTRRVVKPPEGASHDEGYGCTPDVMRDLVRRQCAEDAEADRQFPGLSVEANECDPTAGLYADVSGMVFGSNAPDWVRVNALFEWNGHLYLGTETQSASGAYAAIYRSADGDTWDLVEDGAPDVLYSYPITGVHCFAEWNGWLYAGCSQDWFGDDALVMRTFNGTDWSLAATFPNDSGIWALAEFDGMLYAGTTGYTGNGSETYLWRTADGLAWNAAADVVVSWGICPGEPGGSRNERVRCSALYVWGVHLYLGIMYKRADSVPGWSSETYRGRVYRTDDGTTMTNVLNTSPVHEFLSFMEFNGQLYAGSGRTRYDDFFCGTNIDYASGGRIYRSGDGAAWTQVFGGNLQDSHYSSAITQMIETTNDEGAPVLWAASGWRKGGSARIYSSEDGETWFPVAYLTVIPYPFVLGIALFSGEHYAATGCYAHALGDPGLGDHWTADYGDVWRIVPVWDDIAESGMMGRWTSLLDKLQELAEQSGRYDFRIVGLDSFLYCGEYQTFEFQVRTPQWGEDNRWDGTEGVSFSIQRGNMDAPEYAEVRDARPTLLYVLGPSSGDERTVEEFTNSAAVAESPWGRVEASEDAQSIDSPQALQSIGWSELELQGPFQTFEFQVLETDALHWKGGWDLGDIVTAVFR